MLLIAGTIKIQPEDRDVAVAALIEMMAETAKEKGCVAYDFSADLVDPTLFHLFEEWETAEDLKAHGASAHMAEFQAKVAELGPMERKLSIYPATDKNPLG